MIDANDEGDVSVNLGPLGPFEQLMEGERFRGYKNKNQLTIKTLD